MPRTLSPIPECQSVYRSVEPPAKGATCLCLVWDDVLFPSTELFDRLKAPLPDPPRTAVPWQHRRKIRDLSQALEHFLTEACKMSDQVLILCYQPFGWVEKCVGAYLPDLLAFFTKSQQHNAIQVLYVHEKFTQALQQGGRKLPEAARAAAQQQSIAARRGASVPRRGQSPQQIFAAETAMAIQEWSVAATLAVMKFELFGQKHKRPWRSVVTISSTMHALTAAHLLGQDAERRTFVKSIRVPEHLSIEALSLRLRFDAQLLPVYTLHGADFKVNMTGPMDPPAQLAKTLFMPQLQIPYFTRFAWGLPSKLPSKKEIQFQLAELRLDVSDGYLFSLPAGFH